MEAKLFQSSGLFLFLALFSVLHSYLHLYAYNRCTSYEAMAYVMLSRKWECKGTENKRVVEYSEKKICMENYLVLINTQETFSTIHVYKILSTIICSLLS